VSFSSKIAAWCSAALSTPIAHLFTPSMQASIHYPPRVLKLRTPLSAAFISLVPDVPNGGSGVLSQTSPLATRLLASPYRGPAERRRSACPPAGERPGECVRSIVCPQYPAIGFTRHHHLKKNLEGIGRTSSGYAPNQRQLSRAERAASRLKSLSSNIGRL